MAGIFDSFLEQLIPAMGSAIRQWNIGTEPIRDYFDPVLGLGDPERRKQLMSALTGGQTARQVLLGEFGDLKFQQGIDRNKRAFDATIGSAFGDVPFVMGNIFKHLINFNEAAGRPGITPEEDKWQRRHLPPLPLGGKVARPNYVPRR